MSHTFSGASGSHSPLPTSQEHRRPSYATVAAGVDRQASTTTNSGRGGNMSWNRSGNTVPAAHETSSGNEARPVSGGPGGAGASWASDSMRFGADRMGCLQQEEHPPFFIPSYLRASRHVQRLHQAYAEHLAELQEFANRGHGLKQASLSTSSSSVNLSKMPAAHVHRGVMHDVVERLPPTLAEEEKLQPLPTRWSEDDKMNGLEIMADGTEVRFNGVTKTSDEAAAVRSDYAMPRECGIYYFEVTILSRGKDGLIGIGFSSKKATLNRLPGWETESWAYHGDDGYVFACTASGKAYGPRFAAQDVIGCGVNFRTGSAFFTKNGNYLGIAFNGIKNDRLFPSVGVKKPSEHLRINFGKTPFVFDIDRMIEQERQGIIADIAKTDVAALHSPDDENALIHNLIGQYLAHEGYVETAKAFTRDVHERQLHITHPSQISRLMSEDDDIHAINRQRIRKSILDGDMDRALKYTTSYYPRLFDDERNKDIYFRLRCRKFIEMMRRFTELSTTASSPTTVTKSVDSLPGNGHTDDVDGDDDDDDDDDDQDDIDDQPDTQMELDKQLNRENSRSREPVNDDVDMDVSQELPPKISYMKADQLLALVVRYGQDLREDFGRDPRPSIQKQLQDIFAIMAYTNLSGSPVSHLFDPQGRVEIAEEVNGAILVSLGKPSSAALEKLCAQTEALLDETASKTGGAAAFVNVRKDFLQG